MDKIFRVNWGKKFWIWCDRNKKLSYQKKIKIKKCAQMFCVKSVELWKRGRPDGAAPAEVVYILTEYEFARDPHWQLEERGVATGKHESPGRRSGPGRTGLWLQSPHVCLWMCKMVFFLKANRTAPTRMNRWICSPTEGQTNLFTTCYDDTVGKKHSPPCSQGISTP